MSRPVARHVIMDNWFTHLTVLIFLFSAEAFRRRALSARNPELLESFQAAAVMERCVNSWHASALRLCNAPVLPLGPALASVGLAPDITQALLGTAQTDGVLSKIYRLTRCYEQGDWDEVEKLSRACGFPGSAAGDAYVEAALWAERMLQAVGD